MTMAIKQPSKSLSRVPYGYRGSANGKYVLKRDGKEVMRGTETEVWQYVQGRHSFSVDWAIKNEGYRIEPEVPQLAG